MSYEVHDPRVLFFLRWLKKNHVFIWLCQVLVATCGLLFGCAVVGSVVVACRLSCPETSGILVPQTRIEPVSPTLEGGFLTTGSPEKSLEFCLMPAISRALEPADHSSWGFHGYFKLLPQHPRRGVPVDWPQVSNQMGFWSWASIIP